MKILYKSFNYNLFTEYHSLTILPIYTGTTKYSKLKQTNLIHYITTNLNISIHNFS